VVPANPRRAADGSMQLSTAGWAPGIYWVRAEIAGQLVVRKLVKE
jgi:hypothetical protein